MLTSWHELVSAHLKLTVGSNGATAFPILFLSSRTIAHGHHTHFQCVFGVLYLFILTKQSGVRDFHLHKKRTDLVLVKCENFTFVSWWYRSLPCWYRFFHISLFSQRLKLVLFLVEPNMGGGWHSVRWFGFDYTLITLDINFLSAIPKAAAHTGRVPLCSGHGITSWWIGALIYTLCSQRQLLGPLALNLRDIRESTWTCYWPLLTRLWLHICYYNVSI